MTASQRYHAQMQLLTFFFRDILVLTVASTHFTIARDKILLINSNSFVEWRGKNNPIVPIAKCGQIDDKAYEQQKSQKKSQREWVDARARACVNLEI